MIRLRRHASVAATLDLHACGTDCGETDKALTASDESERAIHNGKVTHQCRLTFFVSDLSPLPCPPPPRPPRFGLLSSCGRPDTVDQTSTRRLVKTDVNPIPACEALGAILPLWLSRAYRSSTAFHSHCTSRQVRGGVLLCFPAASLTVCSLEAVK